MTNEERASKFNAEIKKALKQFGEYSYHDKGPHSVMLMGPLIAELKNLGVDDVAETLRLVKQKNKKHGEKFVAACVGDLDNWKSFDALLDKHKWLGEYY